MIGAAELPLRCHFGQPVCEKKVGAEPWSYGNREVTGLLGHRKENRTSECYAHVAPGHMSATRATLDGLFADLATACR